MTISTAESLIMEVLWRSPRPLAVEDVTEALAHESGWTEGTVRTLMTRLKKKKAVAASKEGRRLFYRPLVDRTAYVHDQSQGLLDRLFQGELTPLVHHFAKHRDLTPAEIEDLKALIAEVEKTHG